MEEALGWATKTKPVLVAEALVVKLIQRAYVTASVCEHISFLLNCYGEREKSGVMSLSRGRKPASFGHEKLERGISQKNT